MVPLRVQRRGSFSGQKLCRIRSNQSAVAMRLTSGNDGQFIHTIPGTVLKPENAGEVCVLIKFLRF
jgi:hypothetical protein